MTRAIPGKIVQSSRYIHIESIELLSESETEAIKLAEKIAQINKEDDDTQKCLVQCRQRLY